MIYYDVTLNVKKQGIWQEKKHVAVYVNELSWLYVIPMGRLRALVEEKVKTDKMKWSSPEAQMRAKTESSMKDMRISEKTHAELYSPATQWYISTGDSNNLADDINKND